MDGLTVTVSTIKFRKRVSTVHGNWSKKGGNDKNFLIAKAAKIENTCSTLLHGPPKRVKGEQEQKYSNS